MLKTLTLAKRKTGLSRAEFFEAWQRHTREWDLKDHPEISLNLLRMVELPDGAAFEYDGMAENHWPDRAALDAVVAWYETEEAQGHMADLLSFMDVENSPTLIISEEADIS